MAISLTRPRVGASGLLISFSISGTIIRASVRCGTIRANDMLRSQLTSNCARSARALARCPVVPLNSKLFWPGSARDTTPGKIPSSSLRISSALTNCNTTVSVANPETPLRSITPWVRACSIGRTVNTPPLWVIAKFDAFSASSNKANTPARGTGTGVTSVTVPVVPGATVKGSRRMSPKTPCATTSTGAAGKLRLMSPARGAPCGATDTAGCCMPETIVDRTSRLSGKGGGGAGAGDEVNSGIIGGGGPAAGGGTHPAKAIVSRTGSWHFIVFLLLLGRFATGRPGPGARCC